MKKQANALASCICRHPMYQLFMMSLSGHSQSALADLDGSDYEESINTQISALPSALSRSQPRFEEALRSAQLQLNVEWTCNRELKEKNIVLEANKLQCSKKNVPPELLAYDSEIKMLVKKYSVTIELFFPCTPTTNVVSQSSPNFVSWWSWMPSFPNTCAVSETRILFMICSHKQCSLEDPIFYVIFDLPKAHFVPNYPCLEVPEIMKMLGVKDVGTLNPHFTMWYLLLFKDMKVDMRKPFLNWHPLGQILRAALWGKASLAEGFVWCSRPKMNEQKWQVSAVTLGSVAWATTIINSEFPGNGIGHTSKIDYYDIFHAYKQVLVIKWTNAHIQHVISEMNSFIFGKSGIRLAQTKTSAIENLSAEIDAALAAMDAAALTEDDDDVLPPTNTLMAIEAAANNLTTTSHFTTVILPTENAVEAETTNVPKSGRGRGSRHGKHSNK
ncbi:hypothetical protein BKA83DRAFT_4120990 [Pisolithus microcarpus]|nr:hypothetical protein BKA83DRAFT_4120990 [Pisolithus microcarpus]